MFTHYLQHAQPTGASQSTAWRRRRTAGMALIKRTEDRHIKPTAHLCTVVHDPAITPCMWVGILDAFSLLCCIYTKHQAITVGSPLQMLPASYDAIVAKRSPRRMHAHGVLHGQKKLCAPTYLKWCNPRKQYERRVASKQSLPGTIHKSTTTFIWAQQGTLIRLSA